MPAGLTTQVARRYCIERLEERRLLLADLLGTAFNVTPSQLPASPTITIGFTVRNQGQQAVIDDAPPFDVDFYLSDNSTIVTSDTKIGTFRFTSGLHANTSSGHNLQFALAALDPFHTDNQYFIGMIVDAGDEVFELSESNNSNRGQGLDRDTIASEAHLPSPTDGTNVGATSLPIGSSTSGSFSDEWIGARDEDIYVFTAPTDKTISFDFDTTTPAASQNGYLRLFDSSWSLVAENDDAAAPGESASNEPYLAHTFTTGGTNYLVVSGSSNQDTNPRTLSGRLATESGTYQIRTAIIPNAPSIPDLDPASDTGQSNIDNITNDSTPTFNIVGEPGGTAKLYVDGFLRGTDTTSTPGGTYVITSDMLFTNLHAVTATITNSSGLEGLVSQPLQINLDTVDPSTTLALTTATDSGRSNSDGITKDTTPSLIGTTNETATITYFKDGVQLGSVQTSTTWTFDITNPLSEGTHAFLANAVDIAGNPSSSSLNATIDTIAPAQPAAPDMASLDDTGRSDSDNITKAQFVGFTGTIEPFGGARIVSNGVDGSLSVTGASGLYSIGFNHPADGTYTLAVKAEDAAGNISPVSPTLQWTYDTVAPGSAYQPDLDPSSDLGFSDTDNLTADNTPLIIGRHDLLDITVEILVDGQVLASGIANASTVNIQLPIIADGTHEVRARAVDAAGNTTGILTTPLSITIETVKPQIVGTTVFNFQTTQNVVYNFSENVQQALAVSDIAVNNLTTGGSVLDAQKQMSYATATNVATLTFTSVLGDGNYRNMISATSVTDAAGNPLSSNNSFDFFFLNADANRDRAVNALDFNALATNFGRTGRNFAQGNFNYDSQVNTLDFNVLASQFPKTLPTAPAVPVAESVTPAVARAAFSPGTPVKSVFSSGPSIRLWQDGDNDGKEEFAEFFV